MSDPIHALICPIRSRRLRRVRRQPFWRDDRQAQRFGVAQYGCHRCGRGAVAERDAVGGWHPMTTPTPETPTSGLTDKHAANGSGSQTTTTHSGPAHTAPTEES